MEVVTSSRRRASSIAPRSTRRTTGTDSASRGSARVSLISTAAPDPVRPAGRVKSSMTGLASSTSAIRADLLGGGLRRVGLDLDLDVLADAHADRRGEAQRRQRVGDRLALRVEDLGLEQDVDEDGVDAACGRGYPTGRSRRRGRREPLLGRAGRAAAGGGAGARRPDVGGRGQQPGVPLAPARPRGRPRQRSPRRPAARSGRRRDDAPRTTP